MSSPSGVLNLSVSDTPVDGATNVMVTFTGVEIQPAGKGEDHNGGGNGDMNGGGMGEGEGAPSANTGTIIGGPMDDADPGDTEDGGGDDNDGAPSAGTTSAPPPATSTGDVGSDDSGGNEPQPLTFTFPTPRSVDLMQQQGGSSAVLLSGVNLPAGNYTHVRLMVASTGNIITLSDGSVHPLTIPSGDEAGLELMHGFTVADGGVVNFTIDFDLRQSITLDNGQYILKPVLRIVNNLDVGRISGDVANTFMIGTTSITDTACMPAAYIYAGTNVPPVDINPTSTVQPVATASVKLDDDSGDYRYSAGFLAPGDYTVALVCAAGDNPATADSLTFSTPKNATVASDASVAVDFP